LSYQKRLYCEVTVDRYVAALQHLLEDATVRYQEAEERYKTQRSRSDPRFEEAKTVL
jgi:hypothetical protein